MKRLRKYVWKGAVGIAILLAIWHLVAMRYDSVLVPTPVQVLRSGWGLLLDGTLAAHIATSLARFVIGYAAAAVPSRDPTRATRSSFRIMGCCPGARWSTTSGWGTDAAGRTSDFWPSGIRCSKFSR